MYFGQKSKNTITTKQTKTHKNPYQGQESTNSIKCEPFDNDYIFISYTINKTLTVCILHKFLNIIRFKFAIPFSHPSP